MHKVLNLKMKLIVIAYACFLFISPLEICSQSSDFNKLSFGVSVSPGISHRFLEDEDKKREDAESPQFSTSLSLLAHYYLSSSFGIHAGLGFSSLSYGIPNDSWDYIYFGSQVDPTTGVVYSSQLGRPDDKIALYQWKYFEIPAGITFRSTYSKFNFTSSMGLSYGILYDKTFDYFQGQTENASLYSFKDNNIFLNISAGASYRIGSRLEISLSPLIKYGLITISNAPNSVQLYHLGADAGIRYFLK